MHACVSCADAVWCCGIELRGDDLIGQDTMSWLVGEGSEDQYVVEHDMTSRLCVYWGKGQSAIRAAENDVRLSVCLCMYVCMSVCMYVCLYVCM